MSVSSFSTPVKCGNCKAYHEGVAAVRACFAAEMPSAINVEAHLRREPISEPAGKAFFTDAVGPDAVRMPTAKQITYVAKLTGERNLPIVQARMVSLREASDYINWLLGQAKAPGAIDSIVPIVPDGRYAIDVVDYGVGSDGISTVTKFYRVRSGEGKWEGKTFVDVQAGDDWFPIRGLSARVVLKAIDHITPKVASLCYGVLIGSCGICGRTLTNAVSIDRGIGPICADKMGW